MEKLSEWDESSVEERRTFLEEKGITKRMDVEHFIEKDWKDISHFTMWSMVIYMGGLRK